MKSRSLHWLLELMVVNAVPLGWILPTFNRQHTNALPLPNYAPEDYLQLLVSALREGSIALLSDDRVLKLEDAIRMVSRAERALEGSVGEDFLLRLTDAGGKTWENLAEPKWDRFLKFEMTTLSSDLDDLRVSGLLAGKNEDVVMAYLGWYERLQSVDVDWDTLRIETHGDYQATYWKRLTDVREAVFNAVLQKSDRSIPAPVWAWKMSLGNWHLKPWNQKI